MAKHKIFISYHHENDQNYKDLLLEMNLINEIFVDKSVNTGDIDENLSSEQIRSRIRDKYLQDSTVTILLVGVETKGRKHIDWELYSSMYDGVINRKSGILIVNLPTVNQCVRVGDEEEKEIISPNTQWVNLSSRKEYEEKYPFLSDRIIDNFMKNVPIAVVDWDTIYNDHNSLEKLIENAHRRRVSNQYDSSRKMRRNNAKRI